MPFVSVSSYCTCCPNMRVTVRACVAVTLLVTKCQVENGTTACSIIIVLLDGAMDFSKQVSHHVLSKDNIGGI